MHLKQNIQGIYILLCMDGDRSSTLYGWW